MKQYLDLLQEVLNQGIKKSPARKGMPSTLELFGRSMVFNLEDGFPLLTTKKLSFKNIATELAWFVSGSTNIKFLIDRGCNIWNQDAFRFYWVLGGSLDYEEWLEKVKDEESMLDEIENLPEHLDNYGDCGDIYGYQWRNLPEIDQLRSLVSGLIERPNSRYHILSSWNPATFNEHITNQSLTQAALPACHVYAQFNVRDGYLDCNVIQRSCDLFLGVPYNIASYALLVHYLATLCSPHFDDGLKPGILTWFGNSVHIYENHIEQVKEQLSREPRDLPKLQLINSQSLSPSIRYNDILECFEISEYDPHPSIKAPLSVGL